MKKMVVLMGSPRKQDSYRICKEIEGFMSDGSICFEYIFLKDYEVKDCKGCDLCFQKSEELCPCIDDLNEIKRVLLGADALIIATPVYAYQVPAPLKRLIDRLSYWFHRQELIGIPVFLVVTTAGGGHKAVSRYMKMTISGWGCSQIASISIISPYYFKSAKINGVSSYREKYHNKVQQMIKNASLKCAIALKSKTLRVPSYYDLLVFNGLRTKTVTSKADYEYWKKKGWIESGYFYEVKLGFFKNSFNRFVKVLVDLAIKHYVGKTAEKSSI